MKNLCYFLLIVITAVSCSTFERKTQSDPAVAAQLNKLTSTMKGGGSRLVRTPNNEMSVESFEQGLKETKEQLTVLQAIDTSKLKGDDLIDWKFAQSILMGRKIEQEKIQQWKRDPRVYMTFTGISTTMGSPDVMDKKITDIEEKLNEAVIQMQNGTKQLEFYVPRFQELAVFMAENSLVLFDKEISEFIKANKPDADKLIEPSAKAKASLNAYLKFLNDELPKRTKADFAIGVDTYNELLKGQFLLPYDADSLYRFGWEQFNKTVSELEDMAKKIDATKTWQQLAVEIKNEYPEPHSMIEVHQDAVNKSREHVLKNNLIPIPWKEQVKVVARAEYLRKTSYYGHFSFAKAKDKDSVYTSEMHINPFEDQWDEKRKQEYLVEHDWGVILVTAPHETYAGHHVQGLYQANNPRPLRKYNSISLFGEGWGLYNEQLMKETGFFPNDKILLRQLQLRLWRNARVIYDVGLHTGKMTYDKAISLMTDKVGFLRWASQLEVDASTASPGYFIGYFTGMMEILKMREDYKKKMGDKFTLCDFHEKLLKIGCMPTSLMREALLDLD